MQREFINSLVVPNNNYLVSNPYCKVEIEKQRRQYIGQGRVNELGSTNITPYATDGTVIGSTLLQPLSNEGGWTGFNGKTYGSKTLDYLKIYFSTLDLLRVCMDLDWFNLTSEELTFYSTYYQFEFEVWKKPAANGNVRMEVIRVDHSTYPSTVYTEEIMDEPAHNDWDDYSQWIRPPVTYIDMGLAAGIYLYLPANALIRSIRMIPVDKYKFGTEENNPHMPSTVRHLINIPGHPTWDWVTHKTTDGRINVVDLEFSKNGVSDLDEANIRIAFDENYYTEDNPYSGLVFDALDSVTIYLGQDRQSAIPMFGGYISGYQINEARDILELSVIDRMWDLSRAMMWKNFRIGSLDTGLSTQNLKMPFVELPSINEIARYCCTTDFGMNFNSITRDYAYYNNFGDMTQFGMLTPVNCTIDRDETFGHPAPCVRIRYNALAPGSVTLYSNSMGLWDAAVHEYFSMDYYASGAGVLFPVKFNLEFDVYKDGQLPSSAVTYTLPFTGPSVTTNVLPNDGVHPRYNGDWQAINFNLKEALDKTKASSTHYYVSAVRMVLEPNYEQLLNTKCSSIYIDHIMAYGPYHSSIRYHTSDAITPLSMLQDMADKTNTIIYTRPGTYRGGDEMILIPKRFYTIPYTLKEGDNILDISGFKYLPLDWGLYTTAHRTFNYDENRSDAVQYEDSESIKWYNWSLDHEFISEVYNSTDAMTSARKFVEEHKFYKPQFEVTVLGSAMLEPGQYIQVKIPSKRIDGYHEIKGLQYKYDAVNNKFVCVISFNGLREEYMQMLRRSLKEHESNLRLIEAMVFRYKGLQQGNLNTSSGGYI